MEQWKDVEGYEGRYTISDRGRVKSLLSDIIMRPAKNSRGYSTIALMRGSRKSQKSFKVHTLVAAAFLGPRPEDLEVNHKNGVKTDNCIDNLEYVTRTENMRHAWDTGLFQTPRGSKNGRAKLTEKDVLKIRRLIGVKKHKEIAKMFGVAPNTITNIATGLSWGWLVDKDGG